MNDDIAAPDDADDQVYEELLKLEADLEAGTLTREEFDLQKAQLLERNPAPPIGPKTEKTMRRFAKRQIIGAVISIIGSVFVILGAVLQLTGIIGGRATRQQEDMLNYLNVQMPKVAAKESALNEGLRALDDSSEFLTKKQLLYDSSFLILEAGNAYPETRQLRKIHEIYMSVINQQHEAYKILLSKDIEDEEKREQAYAMLDQANEKGKEYNRKLDEYAAKLGVEVIRQ